MTPPEVIAAVTEAASAAGVDPSVIWQPAGPPGPTPQARIDTIIALAGKQDGGAYVYQVNQLAQWFGVSRQMIHTYRKRAPGYEARPSLPGFTPKPVFRSKRKGLTG